MNRMCYGGSVSSFEREFNSAVEAVERDVFINLVCENPQLTLAELTRLGKGKFASLLGSVCVGDIIQGGRHGIILGEDEDEDEPIADDRPGKPKTLKPKAGKVKAVNTRTPEGRRAYDAAVLAVIEEAERSVKAPEITSKVGGTALQVRKSLARLIDLGKVTWEGKARGMRYSVV
jgi:hypothetical protein